MMVRRLTFLVGLLVLLLELGIAAMLSREGLHLSRVARAIPGEERAAVQGIQGMSLSQASAASLDPIFRHLTTASSDAGELVGVFRQAQFLLAPALHDQGAQLERRQILAALTAVQEGGTLAGMLADALPGLLNIAASPTLDRQTLLQQISQRQPQLAAALALTSNVDRELAIIRAGRLHAALATSLDQEYHYLPLAEEGMRFAIIAPGLLGADGPVSYLVVAQDPADLRPTGGFLGSWGVLTIRQGQITALKYQGYVPWEDVRDPNRQWPLQTPPVQRYLGYCCMDMQDANWYPDFPTTARALELFSEADQPVPISGVVAVDPAVVQMLLRLTGPIVLPAQHVTVTDANLVSLANYYEGRGPTLPPSGQFIGKEFLTVVAQALVTRLTQTQQISLTALGQALLPLLNNKHILVALNTPDAAAILADFGWDGGIRTAPGDYVMVDDMSMSDNKVDDSVSRSLVDTVHVRADGSADAAVSVTISNNFPQPIDVGSKTTDFGDYVRLYLPPDATAVQLTGVDDVWPVTTESGHVVAAGYLTVPRGISWTLTISYHVPAAVVANGPSATYMLHVQVQPGIPPVAFQLHVLAPNGTTLLSFNAPLPTDKTWAIPVAAAGTRVATPLPWDRSCAAYQLVAGVKGPFSSGRLQVPATCASNAKPS